MLLDLLAALILVAFAVLGAFRGAVRTGIRFACWLIGYAGAILAGPSLSPAVTRELGVPPPLSLAVAGAAILVGVWILGGLIIWIVERYREEQNRGAAEGVGGALFGAAQGALLVLLLGWLGLWIEAADQAGASLPVPSPSESVTTRLTSRVFEAGLDAVVGDDSAPGARVAAQIAGRPAESVERIQKLIENPRIVALREDQAFWAYVRHGSVDAAMNQGSFLSIAYDDTLRRDLASLGVVGRGAAADPRLFRNESREVLAEVGERMARIADSPEMKALAEDPEVRAALNNGDSARLLLHPGVRQLLGKALSDEAKPTGL